jgi:hypothetical protein
MRRGLGLFRLFLLGVALTIVGKGAANTSQVVFADFGPCDANGPCKVSGCPGGETTCCTIETGGGTITCYQAPIIE